MINNIWSNERYPRWSVYLCARCDQRRSDHLCSKDDNQCNCCIGCCECYRYSPVGLDVQQYVLSRK